VAATVGSLRKPLGKTLILASLDAGAHDALDELGWKSRKAIRSGETASSTYKISVNFLSLMPIKVS
jgi:hypothetical protein